MINVWFDQRKDWGIFILRLFIGLRLIYGVLDNVFSWEHMQKFRDFLQQFGFPMPMVCAIVSVYAQLFSGIMILIGWKIRIAASLMIFNFLVAIIMVHWGQSFEQMTPPLAILFSEFLFLFYGAGRISIERLPVHKNDTTKAG